MIPLGIVASARHAAGGGGGSPTVVQTKFAESNTLTLDSAPTAGNLLVLGVGNAVTTPVSWTYSHTLTLDTNRNQNGWDIGLVSGVVESGDSATITVTGMNDSFPKRLFVWELSGVSALVDSEVAGANSAVTVSPASLTSGAVVISASMFGGDVASQAASGMTGDSSNSRFFGAHALEPGMPFSTTLTWTTARDCATALGGYS